MKLFLAFNPEKESASGITEQICTILKQNNIEYEVANVSFGSEFDGNKISESDVTVVIGGDGTIIHLAKMAARFGRPVLGINAGRVGYLAGLETNALGDIIKLVTGEYSVSERMMLSVECDGKKYYCLNDAVVSKGALSRIIDVSASFNGDSVSCRADGMIIATPTGSTAYSMSAGGPIIDPTLNCIVISPICAHSLFSRPLVLGGNYEIAVTANNANETDIWLTVDGEESLKVSKNSEIIIKKADRSAQLITVGEESLYKKISQKLK